VNGNWEFRTESEWVFHPTCVLPFSEMTTKLTVVEDFTAERCEHTAHGRSRAKEYYHFSKKEAIDCMRNRTVLFVGASYMRGILRGFYDILAFEPGKRHVMYNGGDINKGFRRIYRRAYPRGMRLTEMIHNACFYGKAAKQLRSAASMRHFARADYVLFDLWAWDFTTTIVSRLGWEKAWRIYETNMDTLLTRLRAAGVRTLWISPLYHSKANVTANVLPSPADSASGADRREHAAYNGVPLKHTSVSHQLWVVDQQRRLVTAYGFPWIDTWSMTGQCPERNDGDPLHWCHLAGHSAMMVSRMKAQMIMHKVCKCEDF
jgi:hypothetical protein